MSRAARFLLGVALMCLLASTCGASETAAPRGSAGCDSKSALPAGESVVLTLQVGELEREYRLHLPAGYDPAKPVPLILGIHGYTITAERFENDYTSFSQHADEKGYIVAYPQATGFDAGGMVVTSWNDLACNASPGTQGSICSDGAFDYPTPPECGEPRECDWCSCHDDVAFVSALLDELERTVCVDLDSVFATGMSNGAMFVHRLGCDLSDRVAAIAPSGGALARGFNCAPGPSPKTSIINFYGVEDKVVSQDGTPSSDGFLYTPSSQVMAAWAGPESQRCSSKTSPYPTSKDGIEGFACIQHADCATGAEVVDCSWNGGHDWPRTEDDQFSVDVIWEFFSKNGR